MQGTTQAASSQSDIPWEVAWKGPDLLGEGPLWHHGEKVLYWLDIVGRRLHRLDPSSGKHKDWTLPALAGSIAPREKGGLVAAIGIGIGFITFDSEDQVHVEMQKEVIAGLKVRLNDGKCDRFGRFWFGSIASDFLNPDGVLYRLDPDGTITEMEHHIKVSNGLGWSLDNKTMYLTDSKQNQIYAYDYEERTGNISNKRTFARIPESEGVPDGLTVDGEGSIWSAQWNGFRVTKYRPDGQVELQVSLPAQRPTSCMFGGEQLDTLYVTSASRNVGETESLVGEYHGVLFALKPGVRGLPEPAYQG
jgi:sugar lactone lactonase YvrE